MADKYAKFPKIVEKKMEWYRNFLQQYLIYSSTVAVGGGGS